MTTPTGQSALSATPPISQALASGFGTCNQAGKYTIENQLHTLIKIPLADRS